MTRKMTKEERGLRELIELKYSAYLAKGIDINKKELHRSIRALVRAVEERCAEVAETFKDKYVSSEPFVNGVIVSIAEDIAAAPRRGEGGRKIMAQLGARVRGLVGRRDWNNSYGRDVRYSEDAFADHKCRRKGIRCVKCGRFMKLPLGRTPKGGGK